MGLTLADLRSRVQALGYGTDVQTQTDLAINAAQNRVASIRRWPFMVVTNTQSTAVDDGDFELSALATPIERANAVYGSTTDDEWVLTWLDPNEFWRVSAEYDGEQGRPEYWTVYEGTVFTRPVPDGVYVISIDGVQSPTTLSSGTDETIIPSEYGEVLVWGAVSWMAFRQRDWAARAVAEEMFSKHLNAMLTALVHEQTQNAGEVVRWSGWSQYGAGGRDPWLG